MRVSTEEFKDDELEEDSAPLVKGANGTENGEHHAVTIAGQEKAGAADSLPDAKATFLKWMSLALLVVQNSGLFVVTRFSRTVEPHSKEPLYLGSVVVLFVELAKLAFCLIVLFSEARGVRQFASRLYRDIVLEKMETAKLAIPALCYTIQNNLIFVALSHLSAAAAQVLYQSKTLSTAIFSVLILKKSFPLRQWISFVLLAAGVVLVQSQDAKSQTVRTHGAAGTLIGGAAALSAAGFSGFAGVYLELMFTRAGSSLWVRNLQLALFSIPLQVLAIYQCDREALAARGLLQGFTASTWAVVVTQFAGGMLTAVVIKYAGNILKTFAAVLALVCTCFVSMFIFDFNPTPLFWLGVVAVIVSVLLYSFKLPDLC